MCYDIMGYIYNYQHFGIFGACLKMGGHPKFFSLGNILRHPKNLMVITFSNCNFGVPIFWQTHVAARNWFAVHPSWLILPSNQVPCISSLPRLRLGTWTNLNMHWQKQVFLIRGMVIFWKFMVLIPTGLTMIQLDSSHLNRFNFAFQAAKLPVAGFQSLDLGLHHGCQP